MSRWLIFIRERFEPLSHLLMLGLLVAAHAAVNTGVEGRVAWTVGIGLAVLTFFFKLRLYDELKDFEHDLKFNPGRPLARGLLTRDEVKTGVFLCLLIENLLWLALSPGTWIIFFVAVGYSLLMYNEFFLGPKLRSHLTTYAVTHTFVSALISVSMSAAFLELHKINFVGLVMAISTWGLFNLFEFARKTFSGEEERFEIDSYSKVWKRWGAVLLSASQLMVVAATQSYLVHSVWSKWLGLGLVIIVLMMGLIFVGRNTTNSAKMFRGACSGALILMLIGYLSLL